jgi:hypothetical protein
MCNPLNALAWLANHLATRGLAVVPRDVVMSRAISKLLRARAGDTIRARFTRLGSSQRQGSAISPARVLEIMSKPNYCATPCNNCRYCA